jgi:hypothetical protein
MSRAIPPPMPVNIPNKVDMTGVQSMEQRFVRSRDCKQGEPCRIEQKNQIRSVRKRGCKIEGDDSGNERNPQIMPVTYGTRRNSADQDITNDSSCVRGCERQHENPKDIEPIFHTRQCSTERKDEGTNQIEGVGKRDHVIGTSWVVSAGSEINETQSIETDVGRLILRVMSR